MKVNCPHCGKSVDASVEELGSRQGHLVCPQCLSEIFVDGYGMASDKVKATAPDDEVHFCPDCGKHLPALGLKFCPYCGIALDFVDKRTEAVATNGSKPADKGGKQGKANGGNKLQTQASGAVQELRANYVRSYTYAGAEKKQNRTHKEIVTRRWCYAAIVVLVAVFCMIMYAASRA